MKHNMNTRATSQSLMKTTTMGFIVLASTLFAPHTSAAANADKPNVIVIVSDDHGWGDLPSNWDKTEVRLPALDALAAKGVRFPNYHTVPLCGPSRACMFTGQFSTENGMWRGQGKQPLGSPGYRGIKRDVKMLSEHLAESGYTTGAFGKWHMGSLGGEFGRTVFSQGALGSPTAGRDHHGRCFSAWMAGGGIKAGFDYGQTDEFAYNITENPVHIRDLNATILHQ